MPPDLDPVHESKFGERDVLFGSEADAKQLLPDSAIVTVSQRTQMGKSTIEYCESGRRGHITECQ